MKVKRPNHCAGCVKYHNAGHKDISSGPGKYNSWCCAKGDAASKSIGYCKAHNLKILTHPTERKAE